MSTKTPPLAHSAKGGVFAQSYFDHIYGVTLRAVENARHAAEYYSGDKTTFVEWIRAAAIYHDLGKLDDRNQRVLRSRSRVGLPMAHEDAGVAALDRLGRRESVILAMGHHAGLFSRSTEMEKEKHAFRRINIVDEINERLDRYLENHRDSGCPLLGTEDGQALHRCGFTRRIALSCLVDADHGNTALHYGSEQENEPYAPMWAKRLASLESYVNGLPTGHTQSERHRNALRRRLFEVCRDAPSSPEIWCCEAPVGSGKTTAIMAYLLRVAEAKKLRHIIIILPYTNIISQAVEVYRKALVLPDERPELIVAEHHHRADFESDDLRQYALLWRSPIIVTTAVQFIETLGSHLPAPLRKLHEMPGSAIFVDEMHTAMPSHLWPQVWRWLETWTKEWRGQLVLGSGSLARFWELNEYRTQILMGSSGQMPIVPDLIEDEKLKKGFGEGEKRRIRYCRRIDTADALDCEGLIEFMQKRKGPRILIVNTVHTAAVVAERMYKMGFSVLHLSTALAPAHRELIVWRIKQRLRDGIEDWTLVATSCVEAGMDISFRVGFRERASTASLIQIGGRVNRGDEYENAEVWDILLRDDRFRRNPTTEIARNTLGSLTETELNSMSPSILATRSMGLEWTAGVKDKAGRLVEAENEMEYPEVSNLCRVIESNTITALVDPSLVKLIKNHKRVSRLELQRYSVQMWITKRKELGLEQIGVNGDLFAWTLDYDPDFLGYMCGVLRNDQFIKAGYAII